MQCTEVLELYDDFRDRELPQKEEACLIEHLTHCDTCSLDYEIRDEALNRLQELRPAYLNYDRDLDHRLDAIYIKRRSMWSQAALIAAVLLIGFFVGQFFNQSYQANSVDVAQLNENLIQENNKLIDEIEKSKRVSNQLSILLANNQELRKELSQFSNRIDSMDTQVSEVSEVIADLGGQIQLMRQKGGSRISLIRGSGLAQRQRLRDLKLNHPEWSDVVDPMIDQNDVPEMMVGINLPANSAMDPVVNSVSEVLFGRGDDKKSGER